MSDSYPIIATDVRAGLAVAAFVGVLSFIGSFTLLCYTIYRFKFKREKLKAEPVLVMFIYWIVMDLIQSIATISNFRWALQGKIHVDGYCRAESVFEQIGDTGAAICVIIISLLVLARYWKEDLVTTNPGRKSIILIVGVSFTLLMLILVPATSIDHYYGNTGIWCWIVNRSPTTARLQVATEYLFMWAALVTEFIVYGYLLIRAWFFVDPQDNQNEFNAALGMFWYAVAYAIELIPISVVRIRQFQNNHIPHGWDAFVMVFFGAAGFVNALLFFGTGRSFGFSRGPNPGVEIGVTDFADEVPDNEGG